MGVEIRAVGPSEYHRAGQIVVAAYEAIPGGTTSEGYAAELADVAARVGGAEVLVAVVEETLLGCVTFVPGPSSPWAEGLEDKEAAIRMLGVDPSSQQRGVGRALVEACLQRARSLGREAVFLHTTPWMTTAHRLYERTGFIRVPERDWRPEPSVPLLAYRRPLGPSTAPGTAPAAPAGRASCAGPAAPA
ncbi:MAG: GNAT family N-acetyltransferase, partial [Acidobacteriota bacterium]|nr:GNAT family N-acetyltransferase [Acidobacteriota bacterium]